MPRSPEKSTSETVPPAFQNRDRRETVLRSFGAAGPETEELLAYNESAFDVSASFSHPLRDEAFVETWRGYAEEARETGAFTCLRDKLMQFQFPIREGISETDAYRKATRRGEWPNRDDGGEGLVLDAPDLLSIQIHATPAGCIPLLMTENRSDFETLIQAILHRGEPNSVPSSMGACMVAGYNNWDRIRTYRAQWTLRTGAQSEAAWSEEFRRLIPQKERYQDKFIILSDGPYSGVPAAALGLSDAAWRRFSFVIRREHECAHYTTRRAFSSMQSNAFDELIADFIGITAAAGTFRADWFLTFMGLENFPAYRSGGRLENYRGDPPLSNGAFGVLQALVVAAAHHLEAFSAANPETITDKQNALAVLAQFTLEELAYNDAVDRLQETLANTARVATAEET